MYKELNTKKIGQSISKLRSHREVKASEVARHLKITEQAYTKYERGETPVNITFLNKVAQFFDVNPLHFLHNGPDTVVENIHNSAVALQTSNTTIQNIDISLLETLKTQLKEKDNQIIKHLQVIENLTMK